MRARLTLLAAGVVAAALLVGGPLWVWGVQHHMLEDLRDRDRTLAAMTALIRVRRTDFMEFAMSTAGPQPRIGPVPELKLRGGSGMLDLGGGGRVMIERGAGPRLDAHPPVEGGVHHGLVIGVNVPHRVDPFPEADLLLLTPEGEVEFTGAGESAPPELVDWLSSVQADPKLAVAAGEMAALTSGLAQSMNECLRARVPADDPEMRLPALVSECSDAVDAGRVDAVRRAAQLGWPQTIASGPGGGRWLRTAVLVRVPGGEKPYAVSIASSLASIDATVQALTRSLLLGGPLLLALVAGVAWHLVGRSLRVVGKIQQEVEQIAFGTLDRRLEPPRTNDEVARLVATLNRMLDRVAEGARRQREFIGDASHELRSPIASIRTQLEVALSHPGATEWPRVAGGANAEVIRMQRLVDDLLRIARLDESRDAPPQPSQEIDLDDVVRSESAALQHAKVGLAGVSPVRVRGVEQDLRRIVRNLLENAERYGRGRIEVTLRHSGSHARLEIEDDGPGIPRERRAFVFERFARLDESRSRSGGGVGLGLSLARGLVEAHGGEIWIEDARIGGARLLVSLPVDASASPA